MRVLLVEDEPSQQETLGIALTAIGHTVVQASDVPEALARLNHSLDAAILDVRVPDPSGLQRDGLTVLAELRIKHPHIPIAVFTGVPLSEDEAIHAAAHSATVFYKPQTFDVLIDFLAGRQSRVRI